MTAKRWTTELEGADVVVAEDIYIPRIHVASIETCGCVASWDSVEGHLTLYMTTQAPHAIRTVVALVTGHLGLAEHKIRVISPDIGGGFGGKVPVYPGYVLAVAASVLTGKPVKWIEDRSENLQADSFRARLSHSRRARRDQGRKDYGDEDEASSPITARSMPRRIRPNSPRGCFPSPRARTTFKRRSAEVDGVYTNKPPGRYRLPLLLPRHRSGARHRAHGGCAGAKAARWTPPELRSKNFIKPEQFPYKSALGWEYDSGNYQGALDKAMEMIGYDDLRKEQKRKTRQGRADGHRYLDLYRNRRRRTVAHV